MHLGFDLDEVIAKTAHMAVDHLNTLYECGFGIDVFENFRFNENSYSTDETVNEAAIKCLEWAVRDEQMLSTVDPYPEAIRTLNIFRRMGHKIFIITNRNKELKEITTLWLNKHRVPFDQLVLTDNEPKSTFARQYRLDCFVDDLIDNLEDMQKGKSPWRKGLVLMTRPWNEKKPIDATKFIRAYDWNDILQNVQIRNRLKG